MGTPKALELGDLMDQTTKKRIPGRRGGFVSEVGCPRMYFGTVPLSGVTGLQEASGKWRVQWEEDQRLEKEEVVRSKEVLK